MPDKEPKLSFDMRIARRITPQGWMHEEGLARIFEVLTPVLCVGGAVRAAVLGRAAEDVDLATSLRPEEVMGRLERAGIRVVPTGIDHGTVMAVIDGKPYEITTLRRDVTTDGRRATVAYTPDWTEDARRRDFTMNTLLMDLEGNIYDPLGEGVHDLEAGLVRFVGDPAQRIAEDYLRILRFFRFTAQYGKGKYEPEGLAACKDAADKVPGLSRERITTEVFKILVGDAPHETLRMMFEHKVLREIRVPGYAEDLLKSQVFFQTRYSLISLSARLFVLAGGRIENLKMLEKVLLIPKVFVKDMEAIGGALTQDDLSCDRAVRACIYRFGRIATAQVLMLELAQDRVMNSYAQVALKIIQGWDVPQFPLKGEDLITRGMKPGPEMGAALQRIEDWWIAQDFKPDKNACLQKI